MSQENQVDSDAVEDGISTEEEHSGENGQRAAVDTPSKVLPGRGVLTIVSDMKDARNKALLKE